MNKLGLNQTFPIYNADGTSFYGLVLRKPTFDSVVMSLGDKITGDVYYKDTTLNVTMQEYIEYKNDPEDVNEEPMRFVLVNPPTIVREGMVSDNSDLRGMTRYSFEFYHPMYTLGNIPFNDVAVNDSEERYLSESNKFSWIGKLVDFVDKLNANLATTKWYVVYDDTMLSEAQKQRANELSEVLAFDKNTIGDALKKCYDTWEIPFIISNITEGDLYAQGRRFLISLGLPSEEIPDGQGNPFVFRFGQGVGLKNNSRTPKNNKIVTRIVGHGSEDNVPYGYPQIVWTGNQAWGYTINNRSGIQPITIGGVTYQAMSYPIYDGIVGGEKVRLIKHPFTRAHLMPSIYAQTVNAKVNPLAQDYNPETRLVDYYDAPNSYPNPIVVDSPSVEIHEFEKIKPELGTETILDAKPDGTNTDIQYMKYADFVNYLIYQREHTNIYKEKVVLNELETYIRLGTKTSEAGIGGSYTYTWEYTSDSNFYYVKYASDHVNFEITVLRSGLDEPTWEWDDSIGDDGKYKQEYFKVKLPVLSFDLYASAALTQEMKINMRSGACIGCTFDVMVDWDDYKNNFYGPDGDFSPSEYRDYTKYPNSAEEEITLILQKDTSTFGTLMPNIYQQPQNGDKFVVLGISLPLSYITNAQTRLDSAMMEYMRENNVYYYEYPLKFDEYFLANNLDKLRHMKANSIIRFNYNGITNALYIKQITIKWGERVLPQYNITLTDDVEIVLNKIGQVTDDVSRMRVEVNEMQKYYGESVIQLIGEKLSRVMDDVAEGRITFQQGLNAIGSAVFSNEIRSSLYENGMYLGKGWRIDELGNGELESLRVRSYLEVVELLINRLQAQEGDTLFSDNDQVQMVEEITQGGVTYYRLSLKEKWAGYVTAQKSGNIIKGIVNTLAAKDGQVSDVEGDAQGTQSDGDNTYYTSWMIQVDAPSGITLGTNQILVTLYGDNETPAGKNFKPCELMTIARWGCMDAPSSATESEKADVERRQRSFYISTTDGRITKMRGVNSPILRDANYGTTLGILPDFVRNLPSISGKLIDGRDYLYAQGVVVGDFIKIDYQGEPVINYIDKGEWEDNTTYLANAHNEETLQWETHDVWHNGAKWRCRRSQPIITSGVAHYYEPSEANHLYWDKIYEDGGVVDITPSSNVTIECDSTGLVGVETQGTRTCVVRRGDAALTGVKIYSVDGVDYREAQGCDCSGDCSVQGDGISIIWQPGENTFTYYISPSAHISSHDFAIVLCDSFESKFFPVTFSVIASKKGEQGEQGEQGIQGVAGEQGPQGKIGRNFYYKGLWSNYATTDSFTVTDSEAPYFALPKSGNPNEFNYWVWVGSNGTFNFTQANMPSSSNANWQLMVTDFRYIITEGVFTDFAKLGSGVFNQDWLYSQYGAGALNVWSGQDTRTSNKYIQVGNTSYNPSASASASNPAYVSSANHFSVIRGRKYTVRITSRLTSGGEYYLRVFYADDYRNIAGNAFSSFTNTTDEVQTITFYAERSGEADIASYGQCVVTNIEVKENTHYEKMSPMFVNGENSGELLQGTISVNGSSFTSLTASRSLTDFGLFVVAGMSYNITICALSRYGSTGGTLSVALCNIDTTTQVSDDVMQIQIPNTSAVVVTKSFTIKGDFSGYATLRAYMNGSGYEAIVTSIAVEAINPFIPNVAIDWRTGYAHFGGDTTQFNADGSGFISSGGFSWDNKGNTFSRGFNRRAVLNITQDNYDNYVIEDNNWGVLELSRMGQWINFTYNKVTGTAPTVQIILPATWTMDYYSGMFTQDYCRSFVGSKILIYNNGTLPMTIGSVGQTKDCTFENVYLAVGQFCELQCRIGVDENNVEDVYWTLNTQGTIKN